MSVTTPSTGQKISDFSVGTVDANSFLLQARNGSTEKVSATQIGQFSNLNLLFSQLDTDSKTIVGAINEVNGKDASDIAYDNTSSGLTATDVQAAIDEINSTAAPLFLEKIYTYTAASVATDTATVISKTDFGITDIAGYTPIAMRRIGASKVGFVIVSFNSGGSSSVLSVRNNTSATIANTTFTIAIIYVKSNFLKDLT